MQKTLIGAPLNFEPDPDLQWIEVSSSLQLPGFQIIGLPSPEVAEAKERIRAAIQASELEFPRRRVIVNLSPSSIRKRGTGIDLAMALAILAHDLGHEHPPVIAWGELGLDGSIKPVGQVTRALYATWKGGVARILCSLEDYPSMREQLGLLTEARAFEASAAPKIKPVSCLKEALASCLAPPFDRKEAVAEPIPTAAPALAPEVALLPLPPSLERVIAVSALGSHHLILLGPRGTGKSQAMEWLVALQPPGSVKNRIARALLDELTQSHLSELAVSAPVRRISSNVRPSALIGGCSGGGGAQIRPGEYSLAHGGLLIADEYPEWSRDSRESLREPLERRAITITRAQGSFELPAAFTFAANGNLCPCGGWPKEMPAPLDIRLKDIGIPRCKCSESERQRYLAKLSGPILDRIDLVSVVTPWAPSPRPHGLSELRERVLEARARAKQALGTVPGELTASQLETLLEQSPSLRARASELRLLSLRGRHKALRVALSLAFWDGATEPTAAHFVEAGCYRPERYGLCQ